MGSLAKIFKRNKSKQWVACREELGNDNKGQTETSCDGGNISYPDGV